MCSWTDPARFAVPFSAPHWAALMCGSSFSAPCCTSLLPLLTKQGCPRCLPAFSLSSSLFFPQRFFQVSGTGMAPVPSFLSCCTFSRIGVLIWLCQQGSGQEGITSLCSCCHGDSKKDHSLQSLSPSTARVDAGQVPASGKLLLSVLTY